MKQKYKDLLSRALWTAAQVGLAFITVEALDLPPAWVVPGGLALSAIKSWVATKVGNKDTVTFTD